MTQPQVHPSGEPLSMTSSRGPPLVYDHLHHHHQTPTIGFQMTSFSSLYVEGGLQELVYGEGAASSGVRTAAAMYRRAGGPAGGSIHATAAARLHYAAGIKKEPRDLGYDVTGTMLRCLTFTLQYKMRNDNDNSYKYYVCITTINQTATLYIDPKPYNPYRTAYPGF